MVLKPISHPELEDIRIEDNLFAIGRSEFPFATYGPAIAAELSRRHARIFSEFGAVYIADLGSKNGTTVNGVAVRQRPSKLRDGDEIRFGQLSFRLQLSTPAEPRRPATRLLSLTLTPQRSDLGLQPIVITQFPFLLSKTDDIFASYRTQYPHQVNYISRRHAHIFLKHGAPYVEDLGSTNGTFIGGKRLDEHAVALQEGDQVAFGGHHLVFRVSLQVEVINEPTLTRLSPVAAGAPAAADSDKTTFVAAADSFLDIFCVDTAQQLEDEVNDEAAAEAVAAASADGPPRKPTKLAIFIAELKGALASDEPTGGKRMLQTGIAVAAGVLLLALGLYFSGAPERELKDLLADGDYALAATAARRSLERDPDNPELQALGTAALLKASLPNWLSLIKGRDFAGAAAAVATMKELGKGNAEVQPLLRELEWIGALENYVSAQGRDDAPIQIYADEEIMGALLKQWDDDVQGHQRAYTAISSQVPEFRDWYAEALSHLRKLQSDNSVYLAAAERLKATIATALGRDQPETLDAVLSEYADKYPRLGGVDRLQADLHQYTELEEAVRARRLGPLVALLANLRLTTPPFQERLRTLTANGRLPAADVVAQYQSAAKAWQDGDPKQAMDGLQKLKGGPWAEGLAGEIEHKKKVVELFAELPAARGSSAYEERLLAFYGVLDPGTDGHFIKATEADLAQIREPALKRAQDLLVRAQLRWRQYRDNGSIEGAQRLESEISKQFRSQARLLAEAQDGALQGMRIYTQLKAEIPAPWRGLQGEIRAEAELQRNSLQELSQKLDPGLLKAKLELIGGRSDEPRESP
ncbi:MAG: FHA domain-containing protein [Dechloromonas sp.]|nr:FHA domain-containing protein [Dechloromonas sp.]